MVYFSNELDKTCFQRDMSYGDFKDLTRTIASEQTLRGKAFDITNNVKYYGYQIGLAFMVYEFFDKVASGGKIKNENASNKKLAE